MIYFLTLFDFFELWRLHVSSPGAAPVQTVLPHQAEARVAKYCQSSTVSRSDSPDADLAHLFTMAGVMVDSFHLRCFLKSLWSWWADISLWSMKLMVGGTWENNDCFKAGESVRVGFWDIFNKMMLLFLLFLHILNFQRTASVELTDWVWCCVSTTAKFPPDWYYGKGGEKERFRTVLGPQVFLYNKTIKGTCR